MNLPVITVSELNSYVKTMFDSELMMQSILITGEISNFSYHSRTGHLYFSLKDENASLKAVMFSRAASSLRFMPENGMKVLAVGRVSVFERDGVYQLYVEKMEPDGAGALAASFEQLKRKLEKEGLFDRSHKKPIPAFPKRVGVITSPTGAAVHDILSIIERRFPFCTVVFQGVSVQGAGASAEMTAALEEFGRKRCADVIIIGRGGGSAEDLWCFNDEILARAVAACPIPVISAVGHETDYTICDFVSDLRAPTPSAAAELAVPDADALRMDVASLTEQLYLTAASRINAEKRRLDSLLSHRAFTVPERFFAEERGLLSELKNKLITLGATEINARKLRFASLSSQLNGLNPLSVLMRGYATVSSDGVIVDSANALSVGQSIEIRFADGCVKAEVKEKTGG